LSNYQVLIIGGGPGGYETAIRLNQYGIDCALVEQRRVGGVCLNVGCIPTKALVKSAELWNEMKEADSFGFTVPSLNLDYSKVFERKEKIVAQLVSGVEFLFRKRKIPVFLEKAVSVARQDNAYLLRTDAGTELGAQYLIVATGSEPRALRRGIRLSSQGC
jgi:dihydrolipoamide dehydrogenase